MTPAPTYLARAFALYRSGDLDGALRLLRREPTDEARPLHLLGLMLAESGQHKLALEVLRDSILRAPDVAEFRSNLGSVLGRMERHSEAAEAFAEAVRLDPVQVRPLANLGIALRRLGRFAEAAAALAEAVNRPGARAEDFYQLGLAASELRRPKQAVAAFEVALQMTPNRSDVLADLAGALGRCGRTEESVERLRTAIELSPGNPHLHSGFLFVLGHTTDDSQVLMTEHMTWAERHALKAARCASSAYTNTVVPARRLKVAYMSPDFREHAVGRFIEPVLANHDACDVEVYCYSDGKADFVTERMRGYPNIWRDIRGRPDAEVASLIREDQIDILVELAGHTAGHRLQLLACRPAPIQATYLGYPGTTGMTQLDWKLTDDLSDPPGVTEDQYAERLLRLAAPVWCYRPDANAPPVGPQPAERVGRVTFGCLNRPTKIGKRIANVWARLMLAVPQARLLLAGDDREMLTHLFDGTEMPLDRVELAGRARNQAAYLSRYQSIDIALDPFPYHGTTTTCDSLWMGVPVVTLAGRSHMSRVGVSLLTSVGLGEFVTHNDEEYVRIAAEAAGNLARLRQLRESLRARMGASPLCDGKRLANSLENAYRVMWIDWCERSEGTAPKCPANMSTVKASALPSSNQSAVMMESAAAIAVGDAALGKGQVRAALAEYRRGVELNTQDPNAHQKLCIALERQGDLPSLLQARRRIVELFPSLPAAASDLLYALHHDPTCSPDDLFREAIQWAQRFAEPVMNSSRHDRHLNHPDPDRRLRVGYVSADFRRHTRATFTKGLLTSHDRSLFEIYCYSDVTNPDCITERFRSLANVWRDTVQLSDEDLAALIRKDRIDVLVELSGHMGRHRLLVFARQPAPVQIAYPGYPGTTGLRTLDCLITDADRDPMGEADSFHTEPLVRLAPTALCYGPPEEAPEPGSCPQDSTGHVTFGATNRLLKINPAITKLWNAILQRVSGSRLLLLASDPTAARRHLFELGLISDRLEIRRRQSRASYLALYNEIDLCLDTFPYNGNTTTCDALWMGVPTVSLSGSSRASRHGLHLMKLMDLADLTTDDPARYVDIAVQLARSPARLADLRTVLRDRMKASPLCDARGQARKVEQVYRESWRAWCHSQAFEE